MFSFFTLSSSSTRVSSERRKAAARKRFRDSSVDSLERRDLLTGVALDFQAAELVINGHESLADVVDVEYDTQGTTNTAYDDVVRVTLAYDPDEMPGNDEVLVHEYDVFVLVDAPQPFWYTQVQSIVYHGYGGRRSVYQSHANSFHGLWRNR